MNQKVEYEVYQHSTRGTIVTKEKGVQIGWGITSEDGEVFTAGVILKEDGHIRLVNANDITFIDQMEVAE